MISPLTLTVLAAILIVAAQIWNHKLQQGDKGNLSQIVARKVRSIALAPEPHIIFMNFLSGNNETPQLNSDQDVMEFMATVLPLSKTPHKHLGRTYRSWTEYFYYHNLSVKESIKQTYLLAPYVDSKLVVLLGDIEDCLFFSAIELNFAQAPGADALDYYSPLIVDYLSKSRKLHEYYKEHLVKYDVSFRAK